MAVLCKEAVMAKKKTDLYTALPGKGRKMGPFIIPSDDDLKKAFIDVIPPLCTQSMLTGKRRP